MASGRVLTRAERRREFKYIANIEAILLDHIDQVTQRCNSIAELPDVEGIYFVFNVEFNQIVYVGLASNIRHRWEGHKLTRFVRDGLCYIRWKEPDEICFAHLAHEEAFYIAALWPTNNWRMLQCEI